MSFSYAVVCRGKVILAEFPSSGGQISPAVAAILGQIDPRNPRLTAEQGSVIFTTLTEPDGITYLCSCDRTVDQCLRTNFVNELQREWRVQYGANGASFGKLEKNSEFAPVIERIMGTYNNDRSRRIREAKTNIDEAQAEMTRNVERVVARGQTLNEMEDQANDIADSADAYRRDARELRRRMCCQRYRMTFVVILVLLLMSLIALGVYVMKKPKSDKE